MVMGIYIIYQVNYSPPRIKITLLKMIYELPKWRLNKNQGVLNKTSQPRSPTKQ